MPKKIYIVGAGPGAADLLTVRAATLLRAAEVVLHDDLVPQEILDLCPASAQVINVGKRCGQRSRSQEQINALMVWHARETEAQIIVRLKSGDPTVFGRLGEEVDVLCRAGVEFEIVPGITAASAAAASAKITLTDRRHASALTMVTAHNVRGEKLRISGFDPRRTSFAVYMPGPDYRKTAHELMQAGVGGNTPCLLVSKAGRSDEQMYSFILQEFPFAGHLEAPAILIVGEVARRTASDAEKDLDDLLAPAMATLKENPGVSIQVSDRG